MRRFTVTAIAAVLMVGSFGLAVRRAAADTVVLKDGKRLEGKIKVQELGKYVVIELPGGAMKTVMWDDLKEVEVAAAAGSAAPSASAPSLGQLEPKLKGDKTSVTGQVNGDGVSGTMVHECAEGDPACREQVDVQVKGGDVKAKYDAVEDCATEKGEVCTKKTSATAGKDGLTVNWEKESARRVTGPKSSAAQIGLTMNLLFGGNEMLTMTGITAGLNARLLTGGRFPAEQGGSWFGLFVEPAAQFSYVSTEIDTDEIQSKASSSALLLSGTAGFQWMNFGGLDPKTNKQGGWGIALGGQLGSMIPLSEGKATTTYGGALNVLFPKYNPGTGEFVTEQINLFILPSTDLFLILIGASKTWG